MRWVFVLDMGMLTVAVLVFSLLLVRLKLSVVSAQILAGIVGGPHVLVFCGLDVADWAAGQKA